MIQEKFETKTYHDLPIFIEWMEVLKWLLATTERFPKKVRFTFSDRINTLALNIVEELVDARYSTNKIPSLRKINLSLEKLRVLLRISYESQYLSQKAYEHAMSSLNQIGKSLGGWIKQQESRGKNASQ